MLITLPPTRNPFDSSVGFCQRIFIISLLLHLFLSHVEDRLESESVTHLTHGDDGVFTSVPDPLDVDVLGQVPDLFFGHEGVVVGRVHDSGVVELPRWKPVKFRKEC